ncbi:MAG: protein-disulfide reductase DsbD domain-containing protein [Vicinamibacterales bacterium]
MVRAGKSAAPVPATKIASAQLDLTTFLTDPEVAAGNRVSIVVDVEPKPGMHVYAPGAVGYRVIGLTIAPQPFVRVLPPTYPASEIYHFKPLNERVPVFRKPFRIVQDVLIEGTSQAQAAWRQRTNVTLAGTLEYQACDDKVCFNPVSVPVSWTVALKRLVTERPLAPPAATPR